VVVFTGLLKATASAEELAGVLAHEMQHVVRQHSMRALVRDMGWRATLSLLLGGTGPLGDATAAMVERLGGLRFSRQQETEADTEGVRLLEAAGIDPRGMATFFEKLADRGGEPPAFLSTHPASADRARRIRALVTTAPPPPPLPYEWNWN
jgi:predicted Zn-dependent protease